MGGGGFKLEGESIWEKCNRKFQKLYGYIIINLINIIQQENKSSRSFKGVGGLVRYGGVIGSILMGINAGKEGADGKGEYLNGT